MASALYPSFKQLLLGAGINLTSADIRIVAVDTADYTFSSAHDFLADVPAGARIGATGALTGKSITAGVFDSDSGVITSASGDTFEAIIIYLHTGSDATASLIAFIDGLDHTPDGNNINVNPNASGWFAL